jgi:serine/threonine protein kinase
MLSFGKCIGKGIFGRVFRAEFEGQKYAVKQVGKAGIRFAEAERDALRSLVHKGIVCLYNYTEEEGAFVEDRWSTQGQFYQPDRCRLPMQSSLYLVLELIPGEDLFHSMRRRRLSRGDVVKIGAQVVGVLEYIHSQGFVYRDIKPENIMVLPSGDIKLIDFGFAKLMDKDRTFTTVGSPEYMAPEVILREGHNKAADWWSYGILLYELLCGHPPYRGNSVQETYDEIIRGDLEFSKNIDPSAKDIIRRLLTRDPQQRLGSLGARDLKQHKFFKGLDWELTG